MMKNILALFLSFLFVGTAWAADPFTVAGVPVDASGKTAIEAQTAAVSEGQIAAARILLDRLTLPSERAAKGLPTPDQETVARMIRALEIANEKRSANRYLGDITVAFNPSQVQQFLRGAGLTMMPNQSRKRLVLPVMSGSQLWSDNAWLHAWQNPALSHALTPVRSIAAGEGTSALISKAAALSADKNALARVGQRYGLDQILIAEASPSGNGVRVSLTDVALDTGTKRSLGSVSAIDYNTAALAAIEALETDWKQASVTLAENAVTTPVSVLYRSHADWMALQNAINGSSQIQDARLDALSKDGALMTLTYGGDLERLGNELRFKGVTVQRDPRLGIVLTRTGRY